MTFSSAIFPLTSTVSYIHSDLLTVEEITNLQERIIEMEQVRNSEKVSYENQLEQLRTEYKETKDHLIADNMMKGGWSVY